jgi:formylglycine-generating enzyme required for sulfatase activity
VVLWSRCSVKSRYVKDEAGYALRRGKLVPVAIEPVDLPFRFEGLHTPQLLDWDGSQEAPAYRKLVADIESIVGASPAAGRASGQAEVAGPLHARPRGRVRTAGAKRAAPGNVFRDRLADGSEGPEGPVMVLIPAGEFWMGSDKRRDPEAYDDELPRHRVTIAKAFALGRHPVTFAEYDRFAEATSRDLPDDKKWGREDRPVINVSWEDAVAYRAWLSEQTGRRYRLPTEVEWEYAARAGTETRYWWGDEVGENNANCDGCGGGRHGRRGRRLRPRVSSRRAEAPKGRPAEW